MKKAAVVLICVLMLTVGCSSTMNSVSSSVSGFLADHVPMSNESKELAKTQSDLSKVRVDIAKTEKDLADARQLKIDSHYGMMEAMGHSTGPSMAQGLVERTPTPYAAEQVQMHRQNQDIAEKEMDRCTHELGRLRAQEKTLQEKVQKLQKVAGPQAPEPDGGGGGGGGGGSC